VLIEDDRLSSNTQSCFYSTVLTVFLPIYSKVFYFVKKNFLAYSKSLSLLSVNCVIKGYSIKLLLIKTLTTILFGSISLVSFFCCLIISSLIRFFQLYFNFILISFHHLNYSSDQFQMIKKPTKLD